MVRSMYSGVSGLRSHQTRMDTIGNNIANVNTYGFKSGRTTFRDIYYQAMTSASEPTAAAGGINPSSVGYGSKVGSVDLMMGRSTFTMTDETMDIAIDGEGFFQVQDAAGNTYYTRAGMLGFDSTGNLVDMQGNFVLGVNGDPTGQAPGSDRIRVTLPPMVPTPASVTQKLNDRELTITASNQTVDGNVNFNFTTDTSIADDTVTASITSTGIIIKMNPGNSYASLADFQTAVNEAITEANGGEPHPAGNFQFTLSGDDPFATGPLTAEQLTSTNFGNVSGRVSLDGKTPLGFSATNTVGSGFSGTGTVDSMDVAYVTGASGPEWQVTVTIGGEQYIGTIDQYKTTTGTFNLFKDGDTTSDDYFMMNRPAFGTLQDKWNTEEATLAVAAQYPIDPPGGLLASGSYAVGDVTVALDGAEADVDAQMAKVVAEVNANSTLWNASVVGGQLVLTAKTPGTGAALAAADVAFGTIDTANVVPGVDATTVAVGDSFPTVPAADLGATAAVPTTPSRALGLSSTSFALAGGTAGGEQTIADMTNIYIAPNGVITGLDAQGNTVMIGRIDLATFANPAGLNQSGSSNYMESANSGVPTLKQPGNEGSGKLVGGSLELSNVDLSREFSDMITTQRGYQANSRIITVSDTMLEELINLKR